jgi:hypothetical protein
MKALAILQAGTAHLTVGMWAKPSFLALVRATARFSSVGKVRADCGQSEGKYTESREKSLTHSICTPFATSHQPPAQPRPRCPPASLEKSARSSCHARATNTAKCFAVNTANHAELNVS